MKELNSLDELIALRILIEALRLDGANEPPDEQVSRRKTRQAKGGRSD